VKTDDMIDYMLVRYRNTESAARAKCLAWLNHAQEELWYQSDWWFRRELDDFGFVAGETTYTVAPGTLEVLTLYGADGQPMVYVPHDTFFAVYGGAAVAGAPETWTHGTRLAATGAQSVVVYPKPDQDYSGMVLRELAHTALSDSAASESLVPEQHHRILPTRALALMAQDENKPDMHDRYQGDYERMLQEMMTADARHKRGAIR